MANPPRKTYLDKPAPVQTALTKSSAYSVEDEMARQAAEEQAKIASTNSFNRGLEQGFAGIGEAWHGSAAMTSALLGDEEGAVESAKLAQLYGEDAQKYAPTVSSVSDIKSFSDVGSFAAGALGQLAPSLAMMVTGGGLGAVAAKRLGTSLLRKQVAKQLAKRGLAATSENVAMQASQIGASAGALKTGIAIEQGNIASQLYAPEARGEQSPDSILGRPLSMREKAILAYVGGAASGGLEALPVMQIFGRYGLGKQVGTELKRTLASEVGKQALSEGSTEAAQQLIQRVAMSVADKNREVLGEEGIQELVDSFAAGAIGGGAMGGAGRLFGGPDRVQPRVPPENAQVSPENVQVPPVEQRVNDFVNGLRTVNQETIEPEDFLNYSFSQRNQDPFAALDEAQFGPDELPDITETRTAGEIGANDYGYTGGIQQGETQQNYIYARETRGPKGEVLRQEPFWGESGALEAKLAKLNGQPEPAPNKVTSLEEIDKLFGKKAEYQAIDYAQVVMDEARRLYPGQKGSNVSARNEYIKAKAEEISNTRTSEKQRLKNGQDPLEYLSQFRAISAPETNPAEQSSMDLTDDDMKIAWGEIKDSGTPKLDSKGEPILDSQGNPILENIGKGVRTRTQLRKETTRRKILRSLNEETINTGLNKNADIKLADGKVLNTVSLTLAMQKKSNVEQRVTEPGSLAAKAGEWFLQGLGSLAQRGVNVDIDKIPATQRIYNNITWGQAQEAMRSKTKQDPGRTPAVAKLQQIEKGLKNTGTDVTMAQAKAIITQLKAVGVQRVGQAADLAGMSSMDARKWINRLIIQERKRNPKGEDRPSADTITVRQRTNPDVARDTRETVSKTDQSGKEVGGTIPLGKVKTSRSYNQGSELDTGTPENEPTKQRPIRRDYPSRKPSRYTSVAAIQARDRAKAALERATSEVVSPILARKIAKDISEATGKPITPEQLAGKNREAMLKRLSSITGSIKTPPTQTGYAEEVLMEDRGGKLTSEADLSEAAVRTSLRDQIKAIRAARAALKSGQTEGMTKLLKAAGVWVEGKSAKRGELLANLDRKEAALLRQGERAVGMNKPESAQTTAAPAMVDAKTLVQEADKKTRAAIDEKLGIKKSDVPPSGRDFNAEREAIVKKAEGKPVNMAELAANMWEQIRNRITKRASKVYSDIKNQDSIEDIIDTLGGNLQSPSFYKDWYSDPNGVRVQMDNLLRNIAEKLSLRKVRLATPEELQEMMDSHPDWAIRILRGDTTGSMFYSSSGEALIFINPSIQSRAEQYATLAHEIGHVVFKQHYEKAPQAVKDAIRRDFEAWRDKYSSKTVSEAMDAKQAYSILEDTAFNPTLLNSIPLESREYILDFEEWFADQTARYFETSEVPNSIVGKFFKDLADYLKSIYELIASGGYVPSASIKDFYDSIFTVTSDAAAQVEGSMFDTIRESPILANGTLTAEQIARIKRIARTAFRRENTAANTDVQLAEFAAKLAKAAGVFGTEMDYAYALVVYRNLLNIGERQSVSRAFGTKAMQNRIRALLKQDGNEHGARQIMKNPDALIAYGYQYWKAGRLQLGPKADSVFTTLVRRAARILGVLSDSARATQIFEALDSDAFLTRQELGNTSWDFTSPRQLSDTMVQKIVRDGRQIFDAMKPVFQKVFQSAYSRMASTKNPWLQKLAREFYVAPGSQGAEQGFFEAKHIKLAEYHGRIAKILEGKTKAFKTQVVKGMQAGGALSEDPEIRAVQEQLRSVFQDMRAYLVENGVAVGQRGEGSEVGYFPWVFDAEQLLDPARRQAFKDMLIDAMPESFVQEHVELVNRKRQTVKNDPANPRALKEEVAERIIQSIQNGMGYGDSPMVSDYSAASHTPYFGSFDTRILSWLEGKKDLPSFLSSDLDATLVSYIDQAVKRAEFAKRFGDKGEKIKQMLAQAEKAGMSVEERVMAENFIQAMLGTLGADLNPQIRKGMSYAMVYENLRLLSMSTFSSLVDPLGILVRTGSLEDSIIAARAGFRDIATYMKRRRGEKGGNTARDMAELLGIIEDSLGKEALGYEYGGAYMAGPARAINDKWFELIGIAGLTRSTRVMATAAAENFLRRHKDGDGEHSKRFLDELGVSAEDIKLEGGRVKILTPEERRVASAEEVARDDRVRNAMFRFVDEAILRPDAAQRPIYGSDPRFMLVFHLKGFMYSFYERIMKRAWNEAAEHGNMAPLMAMGVYVPGMIAADMFRDAVKDAFGDWDDDRKDNWELRDWLIHGIDRSGLYGPYLDLATSSAEDYTKFGKMPGLTMAGPSIEHLVEILSMRGGMGSQLARALPGQNLLRPLGASLTE